MAVEIESLIQKYLEGDLDKSQIKYLAEKVSDEDVKKAFDESIEINYLLCKKYNKLNSDKAYQDFISHIQLEPKRKRVKVVLNNWKKYATIFIGIVAIGLLIKTQFTKERESSLLDIPDESITIQFDNGEIELIQNQKDRVINENGKIQIKQIGKRIVYNNDLDINQLVYNTLNIPNGKTFQIQLSDGTLVYLNSGSHLKYPVKFIQGEKREVFISGEAYFKVAEDLKHPFVVNAGDLKVEVLGTEFNVSNYIEYDDVRTVLVTGSVKLSDIATNKTMGILPGSKASWSKTSKNFDVAKVNVADYTAWIDGKLIFRNASFKDIRIKLEKHYNVSIINNSKPLDNTTFNASFDIESIDDVLETFNRNFGIEYKIVNNQVVIN